MPSLSEGLPVAAVEAASRGLAIAGSAIPGLADVLKDGVNGWSLPPSDEVSWSRVIESAIDGRVDLRRRQAESLRVAAGFDLSAIVDAYEQTLMNAAGA